MVEFLGKIVTISKEYKGKYELSEDSYKCYWTNEMIQGLYNDKILKLRNKVLGIK